MQIVILRHGKPKIEPRGRLSAFDFGQWVADYNRAGLDRAYAPSSDAIAQAKACAAVVCSNLPRSIDSAAALGIKHIEWQDGLFRECEMPYAGWNYPRLSVLGWSLVFRMLQVLGYSPNAESFKEARQRAGDCALRLGELAKKHESVLFVGHGSLNWLIAKKLLRMGWVGTSHGSRKYWEFSVYRYHEI